MGGRRVVRGQVVDRRMLARARELRRSMTPEEAILWREVRRNRINGAHIRRQQVIDGLIADFYSNDAALGVEIDGPHHRATRAHDEQRDSTFQARGLRGLHFTNDDVHDRLPEVLEKIRLVCNRRIYPGFNEVP